MAKVELFSASLQEMATSFKVLGHPARLAILRYLAETQSCITGDISDHLPLSRTTVNQHLKELKDLDLIKGEIEGVRVNYCLNTKMIQLLRSKLYFFLDELLVTNNLSC